MSKSIADVARSVKTNNILVYPYAHLSSSLGLSVTWESRFLQSLSTELQAEGFEVHRSPFGYYKSFGLRCLGHPLLNSPEPFARDKPKPNHPRSRHTTRYSQLDGQLYDPTEYQFKPGEDEFRTLVEKEALKKGLSGGEPRFLEYCKKFGIEWENLSDQGHMRYSPEGVMLFDLISEYSWDTINVHRLTNSASERNQHFRLSGTSRKGTCRPLRLTDSTG